MGIQVVFVERKRKSKNRVGAFSHRPQYNKNSVRNFNPMLFFSISKEFMKETSINKKGISENNLSK